MGLIMAENEAPEVREMGTLSPVVEADQTREITECKENLKRLIADTVETHNAVCNGVYQRVATEVGTIGDQTSEVESLEPDSQHPDQAKSIREYLQNIAEGNRLVLFRVDQGVKQLDLGEDLEGKASNVNNGLDSIETNTDQQNPIDEFISALKFKVQLMEDTARDLQMTSRMELTTARDNSQSVAYSEENRKIVWDVAQRSIDKNDQFIHDLQGVLGGSKNLDQKRVEIEMAWEELKQKLPVKN